MSFTFWVPANRKLFVVKVLRDVDSLGHCVLGRVGEVGNEVASEPAGVPGPGIVLAVEDG